MKLMRLLPVCMFVLAPFLVADPGHGWWADLYDQETVPLSKIIQNPTSFRDIDVSFVVQFHKVGQIENPFYTKFEKDRFLNFSAWPDESALWQKDDYKNDFQYLFIDRIAKECEMIVAAKPYQRFVVTGRVESVFKGRPWIEVKGLTVLDESLTEPTLAHLVKAFNFKRLRRYDAAAAEFHLANDVKTLPEGVRFMSNKEEGVCLAAADRPAEALVPLEVAMTLYPKDTDVAKLAEVCKARAAEQPAPKPETGEKKNGETPAGESGGEKKSEEKPKTATEEKTPEKG